MYKKRPKLQPVILTLLYIVDQNFERMEGIVNRDYYRNASPGNTAIAPATGLDNVVKFKSTTFRIISYI